MCGIAGIIQREHPIASDKVIRAMTETLSHRGPDDEGIYVKGNAALGHRRLSILDLSSAGHQPMTNKDQSLWVTYNGEVYNYLELKEQLGEREWKSNTDTEVILAAYEQWGKECVQKFNGIFAFAIWDEKRKELFAARDHLGVKPFYYAVQNGTLYFASEIKALLAAGVRTKPNDKVMYDYLVYGYYQHSAETFFEGIYQLLPGHALTFAQGALTAYRYWSPADAALVLQESSDEHIAEKFFNLFKDAVTMQLRSDVPVGIQLSGGFDSSAITAMINHIVGGQKNFQLFSHIYTDAVDKDRPYMQALADDLGWNIDFVVLEPPHMQEYAEKIIWHQDEAFPGLPTFGLYLLAAACRKKNTPVILGGFGGDEVGAGYKHLMGAFLLDIAKEHGAERAFEEIMHYGKKEGFTTMNEHLVFFVRALASYLYGGTSQDATSFVKRNVLREEFLKKEYPRPEFDTPFPTHLQNMQYREAFYTKLPRNLHSADRAAMAFGIEQRVPFLDHRLVELGLALPTHYKIRKGTQRYIMRRAMERIMPDSVRNAPKRAVPSPQREWFQKSLEPWIRPILSSQSFGKRPYFRQEKVLKEYERYCRADFNPNSFHIWQWLHLELWLRKYFD